MNNLRTATAIIIASFISFILLCSCVDYAEKIKQENAEILARHQTAPDDQYEIHILKKSYDKYDAKWDPSGYWIDYHIDHRSRQISPDTSDWRDWHENVDEDQYNFLQEGNTYVSDQFVIGWSSPKRNKDNNYLLIEKK